jgi:hypothetical protein
MTTGPQHYADAQNLAHHAETIATGSGQRLSPELAVQLAMVHATLALAAATALAQREVHEDDGGYSISVLATDDYSAWWGIASEGPKASAARQQRTRDELAEFRAEYRGVGRTARHTSTADWFRASVAAGCTGISFDSDNDTIIHDDAPACPVHEPGSVVPAENRPTPEGT